MRQLDLLMVQVHVFMKEESDERRLTWSKIPSATRKEVVELIAEILRANVERNTDTEAHDE